MYPFFLAYPFWNFWFNKILYQRFTIFSRHPTLLGIPVQRQRHFINKIFIVIDKYRYYFKYIYQKIAISISHFLGKHVDSRLIASGSDLSPLTASSSSSFYWPDHSNGRVGWGAWSGPLSLPKSEKSPLQVHCKKPKVDNVPPPPKKWAWQRLFMIAQSPGQNLSNGRNRKKRQELKQERWGVRPGRR